MWVVHVILCFLTGGLWLIPLTIYYLIKLSGASVNIADNYLANKYTEKGKAIFLGGMLKNTSVGEFINFYYSATPLNVDKDKKFEQINLVVKSKPKEICKYFYDVSADIEIIVYFISSETGNKLSNTFTKRIVLSENGVGLLNSIEELSAYATKIVECEINVKNSSGRVVLNYENQNNTENQTETESQNSEEKKTPGKKQNISKNKE